MRGRLWFDRMLSSSIWKQFLVLGAVLLGTLLLSYLLLSWSGAEWEAFCKQKDLNKWLLPIYLLIDSNALNNLYIGDANGEGAVHGWMLIVSSITFLLGAFVFNGIVIGIITNSIERRVANHNAGYIHYLKSGHYVIMGYDDMVPSIITHIFDQESDAYVLILSAADANRVKERLRKTFSEEQLKHIILNFGHRVSMDYYDDIHLEAAKQVFIVGLRSHRAHDAINVECVDSICTYLEQSGVESCPERITCVFEDIDTYAAFKTSEIFDRVGKLGIEFVPYNYFAGWAKQVFVQHFHHDMDRPGEEIRYPLVYRPGAADDLALTEQDRRYVHLVFVGTTNFAVAFAMEAAHVLHFPNATQGVRTRITFIEKNADREKDEFIVRNRHLFEVQPYYYSDLTAGGEYVPKLCNEWVAFTRDKGYKDSDSGFLDVEFEFIKGDLYSKAVQGVICQWAGEHGKKQYLSIFLALSIQRDNFVLGMNMPDEVYDNEVPLFIRQDRSDNFVSNLRMADGRIRMDEKRGVYRYVDDRNELQEKKLGGRYANIYPFGMNETAFSADEQSLRRAKLVNYLYNTMPTGNSFKSLLELSALSDRTIWHDAEGYWRKLSVANKWSNLYNAYTIGLKLSILRALRGLQPDDASLDLSPLSEAEVDVLAKVEHNRWNVEKLLMGFRKPRREEDKYNFEDNKPYKEKLSQNKRRFIHHDIRHYDGLDDVRNLDCEFSRYIPWILKMTE